MISKILLIPVTLLCFSPAISKELTDAQKDDSDIFNYWERSVKDGLKLMKELIKMMESSGDLPKDTCNVVFIGADDYFSLYLSQDAKNRNNRSPVQTIINIPNLSSIKSGKSCAFDNILSISKT